jgi:predicted aspartyl protease
VRIFLAILPAICVSIPLGLGAAPRSAPSANSKALQFEALELSRSREGFFVVKAKINDRPALLMVDSGSPGLVIAADRRETFGLKSIPAKSDLPDHVQINGKFDRLCMARSLQLGALAVLDVPVALVASSELSRSFRRQKIDGILGIDILLGTRAVLDCGEQVLVLNLFPEKAAKAPGFEFSRYRGVPMTLSDNFNLYVDGVVNGAKARLLVDTGAVITTLHRPFIRQMHIPIEETPFVSSGIHLKTVDTGVAEIPRLSVGSVRIKSQPIGVADLGELMRAGGHSPVKQRPFEGLLGAEILSSQHGIIDFGTRTLYLKKT